MFPLLTERKNIAIVFSVKNRSGMVFSIHACIYVCIILYTDTYIHTYIQIHTAYMIHDNTVNSVYIGIILSKWLGCKEYIYKVQAMQSSSDNAVLQ